MTSGNIFARFLREHRGSIAIMTALSLVAIVLAIGAGLDLSHGYLARQKLSQSAAMACEYATRPSVEALNTTGDSGAAYSAAVKTFINTNMTNLGFTQNTSPFTYTEGGAGNVAISASVPTTFMKLGGFTNMPIAASARCFTQLAAATPPPPPPSGPAAGTAIMSEGFEKSGCSTSGCWYVYAPGATPGATISRPVSTFPAVPTYTGSGGMQWYVMGYCLENDNLNAIWGNVPQGTHSAELDCDNGSGTAGNSSISTPVQLSAGTYEFRWNYAARVDYPDYNPTYICGSAASDLSWANDTNSSGGPVANALRTNQINVYLDYATSSAPTSKTPLPAPPTHMTMPDAGAQVTLAGGNLVDMCVYSNGWIQRSVKITISQAGYYWLSLAADGQNDSYGGSIDNLMLCVTACSDAVSDNFPSSWTNTNGVLLFQDEFTKLSYSGNIESSNSGSYPGWPSATDATGWLVGPANNPLTSVSVSGISGDGVELDSGADNEIAQPFLLVPGYYQVSYAYQSEVTFHQLSSTTAYCGATPAAANITSLTGSKKPSGGGAGGKTKYDLDTNIVAIFMAHAQLADHPNSPPTSTSLGTATKYVNPNGTVTTSSTTPELTSDGIDLGTYNSSQPNPLLDVCGYSASETPRTATIQISKTAYYWLTASALGTADGYGGAIGNVTLTALGSPYMSNPPSGAIAIPVPAPQPGSSVSLPSTLPDFDITADSFAP